MIPLDNVDNLTKLVLSMNPADMMKHLPKEVIEDLPQIDRLNKGMQLIEALLVTKREIRTSHIRAMWFFQTEDEKALAIKHIKERYNVSVRSELVCRVPIAEWDEIIRLEGPLPTDERKSSIQRAVEFVKETKCDNVSTSATQTSQPPKSSGSM